jgi:hypothetical protein
MILNFDHQMTHCYQSYFQKNVRPMITVTAHWSGRRHGREPDKTPIMLHG